MGFVWSGLGVWLVPGGLLRSRDRPYTLTDQHQGGFIKKRKVEDKAEVKSSILSIKKIIILHTINAR